ncbi:hypothetical protein [Pseudoduganella buxea]|uniref:Uncharacterized protein n=1 Tax=Pseudoduganella buxea TaxID=1949069 RepID=A0A6I3T2V4_9BURK|nr:hypothetical protein [Pseudoduganella buxea]MTV53927.1 hypothetical protein [Pseudoduganella buxea]GGC03537.1 hypothetical protein GCM10011572_26920 [Pseudoduganella buxea]
MTYELCANSAVLASPGVIEIDKETFDSVIHARRVISDTVSIEQKLDFVLSNMLELEMAMVQITTEQMLYDYDERNWFDESRDLLNRKIMNLLSAGRSYIDALPHHINGIFSRDHQKTLDARKILSEQYDSRLGYRAMEALRNYVQHQGLPVHGATHGRGRSGVLGSTQQQYTLDIWLKPDELCGTGFKAKVLAELKIVGNRIDLKYLIRDYVEGLAVANEKIRYLVKEEVGNAQIVIEALLKRYIEECPGKYSDIAVIVARTEGAVQVESHGVLLDPFKYWARLLRKNRGYTNLRRRFVTTAATDKAFTLSGSIG